MLDNSANSTGASPDFLRVYESPSVAESMAESPRFGHTRDITLLFADSPEEQSDYYTGLLLASIITAVFFFVFIVVILVFMCCGKSRVGFLSGRPFQRTLCVEDDYGIDKEQPRHNTPKTTACCGVDRSTWVRLTFIISGTIFIIFSFLMVSEGITNLQQTVGTVHQSAMDVGQLAIAAKKITETSIIAVQDVATNVRGSLVEELSAENFCPNDPDLENNTAGAKIRDSVDEAVKLLSQVDGFVGDDIDDITDVIDEAIKGAEEIEARTENVNLEKTVGIVILVVFSIIPCLLVSAAIMAQFDVKVPQFVCIINWFLLPVFILMVLFCVIVSCGMVATASANSDFCLPGGYADDPYTERSPDTTIKRILDRTGVKEKDFMRQVTQYYVDQCQNMESPYTVLTDVQPDLNHGKIALSSLKERIQADGVISDLNATCGREYDELEELLIHMETIFDVLTEAIVQTLNLISCEQIVPIYHRVVYDGACQYSVSACVWVFASALVMGIFGLIMILCRSAYKPTVYKDSNGEVVKDD